MNEKAVLTQKFMMVSMNQVEVSTDEKSIIGTQGLASCIGFILYNKEYKKAIVGHYSIDAVLSNEKMEDLRLELFRLIYENHLDSSLFDLMIIPGAYESDIMVNSDQLEFLKKFSKIQYGLLEILERNISLVKGLEIQSVIRKDFPVDAFQIVDEKNNFHYTKGATLSKQFAFDAFSGEFVTKRVLFGEEYAQIHSKYIK